MRSAAKIPPALPEWLWEGRIPRGAITLEVGEGKVGKSTHAVMVAALLSRGELTGHPERSLLCLQEDHEAFVTVPRLMVAGADLDFVDLDSDPGYRFPRDLKRLDARLKTQPYGLVVIDPLDASVPALASQKARSILDDLAAIAKKHGVAVICLHHFTKSGSTIGQRIGGGRAVQAAARSILTLSTVDRIAAIILELPEDGDYVVLSHFACNYGRTAEPLLFERLSEPHPIDGGGSVALLVDRGELGDIDPEIVSSDHTQGWKRRAARALIERSLLHGPATAEDLESDVMVVEVISTETFHRARGELVAEGTIETYQHNGRHWWRLSLVPDLAPEEGDQ